MLEKNGGPAFPGKATVDRDARELVPYQFGNDDFETPGMYLRDYFAAKAMQAWLAKSSHHLFNPNPIEDGMNGAEIAAHIAYHVADAMLAERAK
ncbi:hypothetical protein FQZ97_1111270 [compost metagenome]